MRLPALKIGELVARVPIIQGGMGIGISRSHLASAVANEGGIGIISGVQIGFEQPDFETNNLEANIRALIDEIKKARKLSPNGILGVNLMAAMNNYKQMVKAALEAKIDIIVSGAGLPKELPELIKGTKTKIAPIVSSAKAASVISRLWDKRYNYAPDMVIVEGPDAGGHLGFTESQLTGDIKPSLKEIVKEVIEAIKPFSEKYNKDIPVIAAGGIFSGNDIAEFIRLGASGVQMATRFVATYECDAAMNYKIAYINARKEDIEIIKSPVGMPGRAIRNSFIKSIEKSRIPAKKCYDCLKTCDRKTTPYCISKALIEAVKGNMDDALVFVGSNVYKVDKLVSVSELMGQLVRDAELSMDVL